MRHAKVLVVANKYMVPGLAEIATQRIEKLMQDEISAEGSAARVFFKLMVETLYLREYEFGYNQDAVDEGARMKKAAEMAWLQEEKKKEDDDEADQDYEDTSSVHISDVTDTDEDEDEDEAEQNEDTEEEDEDDFDPYDLLAVTSKSALHHPLDRLRSIVTKAAVGVWEQDTDDLGRRHLAVLVKDIPIFGTDLAAAALACARVEKD